jgi:hypothetical protein
MIFDNLLVGTTRKGYIAGAVDGIVTVASIAAKRDIVALNVQDLSVVQRSQSLSNGHYLLNGLDPTKQYLIMARDYNKEYEPAVFDYVTPATDLTIAQQQELWQSWQTSP